MRAGFAGLGRIGAPVARNLVRAGHAVTEWSRSPGPARALVEGIGGFRLQSEQH